MRVQHIDCRTADPDTPCPPERADHVLEQELDLRDHSAMDANGQISREMAGLFAIIRADRALVTSGDLADVDVSGTG